MLILFLCEVHVICVLWYPYLVWVQFLRYPSREHIFVVIVYTHTHTHTDIYTYIYIYIYRERERERERGVKTPFFLAIIFCIHNLHTRNHLLVFMQITLAFYRRLYIYIYIFVCAHVCVYYHKKVVFPWRLPKKLVSN
jgi:hypothetical protein